MLFQVNEGQIFENMEQIFEYIETRYILVRT